MLNKSAILRSIAFITLICFSTTTLAWSAPEQLTVHGFSDRSWSERMHDDLKVISELAEIRLYPSTSSSQQTLFLLSDAHLQVDAQLKINELVEQLIQSQEVEHLFLEGANGIMPLNDLRNQARDSSTAKTVLEYYVHKQDLSGAEMAAVRSSKDVLVEGIESEEAYTKNKELYFKVLREQPRLERLTQTYLSKLNQEKYREFSDLLQTIDEALIETALEPAKISRSLQKLDQAFAKNTPPVLLQEQESDLVNPLSQQGTSLDQLLNQQDLRNLARLLELSSRAEAHFDKEKIKQEARALLQRLRDDTQAVNVDSLKQALSNRGMSWHQMLLELGDLAKVDKASYKNYHDWFVYEQKKAQIQTGELWNEWNRLHDLFKLYLNTDKQRELWNQTRQVLLSLKALKLELSREEYQQWLGEVNMAETQEQTKGQAAVTLSSNEIEVSDIKSTVSAGVDPTSAKLNPSKIDWQTTACYQFYLSALAREQYFLEPVKVAFENKKIKQAILVAGGFHADGLRENAHALKWNVIEIQPKYRFQTPNGAYAERMEGMQSVVGQAIASWREKQNTIQEKDNEWEALVVDVSEQKPPFESFFWRQNALHSKSTNGDVPELMGWKTKETFRNDDKEVSQQIYQGLSDQSFLTFQESITEIPKADLKQSLLHFHRNHPDLKTILISYLFYFASQHQSNEYSLDIIAEIMRTDLDPFWSEDAEAWSRLSFRLFRQVLDQKLGIEKEGVLAEIVRSLHERLEAEGKDQFKNKWLKDSRGLMLERYLKIRDLTARGLEPLQTFLTQSQAVQQLSPPLRLMEPQFRDELQLALHLADLNFAREDAAEGEKKLSPARSQETQGVESIQVTQTMVRAVEVIERQDEKEKILNSVPLEPLPVLNKAALEQRQLPITNGLNQPDVNRDDKGEKNVKLSRKSVDLAADERLLFSQVLLASKAYLNKVRARLQASSLGFDKFKGLNTLIAFFVGDRDEQFNREFEKTGTFFGSINRDVQVFELLGGWNNFIVRMDLVTLLVRNPDQERKTAVSNLFKLHFPHSEISLWQRANGSYWAFIVALLYSFMVIGSGSFWLPLFASKYFYFGIALLFNIRGLPLLYQHHSRAVYLDESERTQLLVWMNEHLAKDPEENFPIFESALKYELDRKGDGLVRNQVIQLLVQSKHESSKKLLRDQLFVLDSDLRLSLMREIIKLGRFDLLENPKIYKGLRRKQKQEIVDLILAQPGNDPDQYRLVSQMIAWSAPAYPFSFDLNQLYPSSFYAGLVLGLAMGKPYLNLAVSLFGEGLLSTLSLIFPIGMLIFGLDWITKKLRTRLSHAWRLETGLQMAEWYAGKMQAKNNYALLFAEKPMQWTKVNHNGLYGKMQQAMSKIDWSALKGKYSLEHEVRMVSTIHLVEPKKRADVVEYLIRENRFDKYMENLQIFEDMDASLLAKTLDHLLYNSALSLEKTLRFLSRILASQRKGQNREMSFFIARAITLKLEDAREITLPVVQSLLTKPGKGRRHEGLRAIFLVGLSRIANPEHLELLDPFFADVLMGEAEAERSRFVLIRTALDEIKPQVLEIFFRYFDYFEPTFSSSLNPSSGGYKTYRDYFSERVAELYGQDAIDLLVSWQSLYPGKPAKLIGEILKHPQSEGMGRRGNEEIKRILAIKKDALMMRAFLHLLSDRGWSQDIRLSMLKSLEQALASRSASVHKQDAFRLGKILAQALAKGFSIDQVQDDDQEWLIEHLENPFVEAWFIWDGRLPDPDAPADVAASSLGQDHPDAQQVIAMYEHNNPGASSAWRGFDYTERSKVVAWLAEHQDSYDKSRDWIEAFKQHYADYVENPIRLGLFNYNRNTTPYTDFIKASVLGPGLNIWSERLKTQPRQSVLTYFEASFHHHGNIRFNFADLAHLAKRHKKALEEALYKFYWGDEGQDANDLLQTIDILHDHSPSINKWALGFDVTEYAFWTNAVNEGRLDRARNLVRGASQKTMRYVLKYGLDKHLSPDFWQKMIQRAILEDKIIDLSAEQAQQIPRKVILPYLQMLEQKILRGDEEAQGAAENLSALMVPSYELPANRRDIAGFALLAFALVIPIAFGLVISSISAVPFLSQNMGSLIFLTLIFLNVPLFSYLMFIAFFYGAEVLNNLGNQILGPVPLHESMAIIEKMDKSLLETKSLESQAKRRALSAMKTLLQSLLESVDSEILRGEVRHVASVARPRALKGKILMVMGRNSWIDLEATLSHLKKLTPPIQVRVIENLSPGLTIGDQKIPALHLRAVRAFKEKYLKTEDKEIFKILAEQYSGLLESAQHPTLYQAYSALEVLLFCHHLRMFGFHLVTLALVSYSIFAGVFFSPLGALAILILAKMIDVFLNQQDKERRALRKWIGGLLLEKLANDPMNHLHYFSQLKQAKTDRVQDHLDFSQELNALYQKESFKQAFRNLSVQGLQKALKDLPYIPEEMQVLLWEELLNGNQPLPLGEDLEKVFLALDEREYQKILPRLLDLGLHSAESSLLTWITGLLQDSAPEKAGLSASLLRVMAQKAKTDEAALRFLRGFWTQLSPPGDPRITTVGHMNGVIFHLAVRLLVLDDPAARDYLRKHFTNRNMESRFFFSLRQFHLDSSEIFRVLDLLREEITNLEQNMNWDYLLENSGYDGLAWLRTMQFTLPETQAWQAALLKRKDLQRLSEQDLEWLSRLKHAPPAEQAEVFLATLQRIPTYPEKYKALIKGLVDLIIPQGKTRRSKAGRLFLESLIEHEGRIRDLDLNLTLKTARLLPKHEALRIIWDRLGLAPEPQGASSLGMVPPDSVASSLGEAKIRQANKQERKALKRILASFRINPPKPEDRQMAQTKLGQMSEAFAQLIFQQEWGELVVASRRSTQLPEYARLLLTRWKHEDLKLMVQSIIRTLERSEKPLRYDVLRRILLDPVVSQTYPDITESLVPAILDDAQSKYMRELLLRLPQYPETLRDRIEKNLFANRSLEELMDLNIHEYFSLQPMVAFIQEIFQDKQFVSTNRLKVYEWYRRIFSHWDFFSAIPMIQDDLSLEELAGLAGHMLDVESQLSEHEIPRWSSIVPVSRGLEAVWKSISEGNGKADQVFFQKYFTQYNKTSRAQMIDHMLDSDPVRYSPSVQSHLVEHYSEYSTKEHLRWLQKMTPHALESRANINHVYLQKMYQTLTRAVGEDFWNSRWVLKRASELNKKWQPWLETVIFLTAVGIVVDWVGILEKILHPFFHGMANLWVIVGNPYLLFIYHVGNYTNRALKKEIEPIQSSILSIYEKQLNEDSVLARAHLVSSMQRTLRKAKKTRPLYPWEEDFLNRVEGQPWLAALQAGKAVEMPDWATHLDVFPENDLPAAIQTFLDKGYWQISVEESVQERFFGRRRHAIWFAEAWMRLGIKANATEFRRDTLSLLEKLEGSSSNYWQVLSAMMEQLYRHMSEFSESPQDLLETILKDIYLEPEDLVFIYLSLLKVSAPWADLLMSKLEAGEYDFKLDLLNEIDRIRPEDLPYLFQMIFVRREPSSDRDYHEREREKEVLRSMILKRIGGEAIEPLQQILLRADEREQTFIREILAQPDLYKASAWTARKAEGLKDLSDQELMRAWRVEVEREGRAVFPQDYESRLRQDISRRIKIKHGRVASLRIRLVMLRSSRQKKALRELSRRDQETISHYSNLEILKPWLIREGLLPDQESADGDKDSPGASSLGRGEDHQRAVIRLQLRYELFWVPYLEESLKGLNPKEYEDVFRRISEEAEAFHDSNLAKWTDKDLSLLYIQSRRKDVDGTLNGKSYQDFARDIRQAEDIRHAPGVLFGALRGLLNVKKEIGSDDVEQLISISLSLHRRIQRMIENKFLKDPRYVITLRELQRFSNDLVRHYQKDGDRAFEYFVTSAYNVYGDMFSAGEGGDLFSDLLVSEIEENITFFEQFLARSAIFARGRMREGVRHIRMNLSFIEKDLPKELTHLPSNEKDLYIKIKRGIESERPLFIMKEDDTYLAVDEMINLIASEEQAQVMRVQIHPGISRGSLFGMHVPWERITEERAEKMIAESSEESTRTALARIYHLDLENLQEVEALYQATQARWLEFNLIRDTEAGQAAKMAVAMAIEYGEQWNRKGRFENGILLKAIDQALQNPDTPIYFVLDDIEAATSPLRAQFFQLLLTGKVEASEIGQAVELPRNLHLIFTGQKNSVIQDAAFYDRPLRKTANSYAGDDIEIALQQKTHLSEPLAERLRNVYQLLGKTSFRDATSLRFSFADLILIAKRVQALQGEKSGRAEDILDEEIFRYFYDRFHFKDDQEKFVTLMQSFSGRRFSNAWLNSQINLDVDAGMIIADGVATPLAEPIREALRSLPSSMTQEEKLYQLLGVYLKDKDRRILSQLIRAELYGGTWTRLEGPSGTGKTFLAEIFSKLIGKKILSQTVYQDMKADRWFGLAHKNKYGQNLLDRDTDMLGALADPDSFVIPSEINTQPDLLWALIPYARTLREPVLLPEYPHVPGADRPETILSLERKATSYGVIDTNPTAEYRGRKRASQAFTGLTQGIWVGFDWAHLGPKDIKDLQQQFMQGAKMEAEFKILKRELQADEAKQMEFIINAFLRLSQFIDLGELGQRTVSINQRELNRTLRTFLTWKAEGMKLNEALSSALFIHFIGVWQLAKDRSKAEEIIREVFPAYEVPSDPDALILKMIREDGSAILLRGGINRDAGNIADVLIKEGWVPRKIDLDYFTRDSNLIGGFAVASLEMDGEEAKNIVERFRNIDADWIKVSWANFRSEDAPKNLPTDLSELPAPQRIAFAKSLDSLAWKSEIRARYKREIGFFPRLIQEAQLNPDKKYLAVLNNYHRLQPGMAVMMNRIFQDQRLELGLEYVTEEDAQEFLASMVDQNELLMQLWDIYGSGSIDQASLKSKRQFLLRLRTEVPQNIRFIAMSFYGEEKLSPAELSRFVQMSPKDLGRTDLLAAEEKTKGIGLSESEREQVGTLWDELMSALAQDEWDQRTAGQARGTIFDYRRMLRNILDRKQRGFTGDFSEMIREEGFSAMGIALRDQSRSAFRKIYTEDENPFQYEERPDGIYLRLNGTELKTRYRTLDEATGQEEPYMAPIQSTIETERAMMAAIRAGDRVLILEGYPGGGKTEMSMDLFRRLGIPSRIFQMHGEVSSSDWLGKLVRVKEGFALSSDIKDENGIRLLDFLRAYTQGEAWIVDEGPVGTRARETLAVLQRIARGEELLYLSHHPGAEREPLIMHPDFRVVVSYNPAGETEGRQTMPAEVESMASKIWVTDQYSETDYKKIIQHYVGDHDIGNRHSLIRLHENLRSILAQEESERVQHRISLREFIRLIRYLDEHRADLDKALSEALIQFYFAAISSENLLRKMRKGVHSDTSGILYGNRLVPLFKQWDAENFRIPRLDLDPDTLKGRRIRANEVFFMDGIPSWNRAVKLLDYSIQGQRKDRPSPTLFIEGFSAQAQAIVKAYAFFKGIGFNQLDSHPQMKSGDLLGQWTADFLPLGEDGKMVSQSDEVIFGQGFISRHLVPEESPVEMIAEEILFIDRIHVLPEKERSVLNDLLLKGYVDLAGVDGMRTRYILPPAIHLVVASKEDETKKIASAFLNRFNLISLPGLLRHRGEMLSVLTRKFSLTREEAELLVDLSMPWIRADHNKELSQVYGLGIEDLWEGARLVMLEKHENPNIGSLDAVMRAVLRLFYYGLEEAGAKSDRDLFYKKMFPMLLVESLMKNQNRILNKPLGKPELESVTSRLDNIIRKRAHEHLMDMGKMEREAWEVTIVLPEQGQIVRLPNQILIAGHEKVLQIITPRNQYVVDLATAFDWKELSRGLSASVSGGELHLRFFVPKRISGITVQWNNARRDHALPPEEVNEKTFLRYVDTIVGAAGFLLASNVVYKDAGGALHLPRAVGLVGETGSAKTMLAQNLSQILGQTDFIYGMHGESKVRDLTLQFQIHPDRAGYQAVTMPPLRRMGRVNGKLLPTGERQMEQRGTRVMMDEANMKPEVLHVLAPLARGEQDWTLEFPGILPLSVTHESVQLLLSLNPAGTYDRASIPDEIRQQMRTLWMINPMLQSDQRLFAILEGWHLISGLGDRDALDELLRSQADEIKRAEILSWSVDYSEQTSALDLETIDRLWEGEAEISATYLTQDEPEDSPAEAEKLDEIPAVQDASEGDGATEADLREDDADDEALKYASLMEDDPEMETQVDLDLQKRRDLLSDKADEAPSGQAEAEGSKDTHKNPDEIFDPSIQPHERQFVFNRVDERNFKILSAPRENRQILTLEPHFRHFDYEETTGLIRIALSSEWTLIPSASAEMKILSYQLLDPSVQLEFSRTLEGDQYFARLVDGEPGVYDLRYEVARQVSYLDEYLPDDLTGVLPGINQLKKSHPVVAQVLPFILSRRDDGVAVRGLDTMSYREVVHQMLYFFSNWHLKTYEERVKEMTVDWGQYGLGNFDIQSLRNEDFNQLSAQEKYLVAVVSECGVCRQRAMAFMLTAKALDIPVRMITNGTEGNHGHAFIELGFKKMAGGMEWKMFDLGGGGDMTASRESSRRAQVSRKNISNVERGDVHKENEQRYRDRMQDQAGDDDQSQDCEDGFCQDLKSGKPSADGEGDDVAGDQGSGATEGRDSADGRKSAKGLDEKGKGSSGADGEDGASDGSKKGSRRGDNDGGHDQGDASGVDGSRDLLEDDEDLMQDEEGITFDRLQADDSYRSELAKLGPDAARLFRRVVEFFARDVELLTVDAEDGRISVEREMAGDIHPYVEERENKSEPSLAIGLTVDMSGSIDMRGLTGFFKDVMRFFSLAFSEASRENDEVFWSISGFGTKYYQEEPFVTFQDRIGRDELPNRLVSIQKKLNTDGTIILTAVEGIIAKYANVPVDNRLEFLLTDEDDLGGGDIPGALKRAKDLGIDIVLISIGNEGFPIFDRRVVLQRQPDMRFLSDIFARVAELKAQTGEIPVGDLVRMLHLEQPGQRRTVTKADHPLPIGLSAKVINALRAKGDLQEDSIVSDILIAMGLSEEPLPITIAEVSQSVAHDFKWEGDAYHLSYQAGDPLLTLERLGEQDRVIETFRISAIREENKDGFMLFMPSFLNEMLQKNALAHTGLLAHEAFEYVMAQGTGRIPNKAWEHLFAGLEEKDPKVLADLQKRLVAQGVSFVDQDNGLQAFSTQGDVLHLTGEALEFAAVAWNDQGVEQAVNLSGDDTTLAAGHESETVALDGQSSQDAVSSAGDSLITSDGLELASALLSEQRTGQRVSSIDDILSPLDESIALAAFIMGGVLPDTVTSEQLARQLMYRIERDGKESFNTFLRKVFGEILDTYNDQRSERWNSFVSKLDGIASSELAVAEDHSTSAMHLLLKGFNAEAAQSLGAMIDVLTEQKDLIDWWRIEPKDVGLLERPLHFNALLDDFFEYGASHSEVIKAKMDRLFEGLADERSVIIISEEILPHVVFEIEPLLSANDQVLILIQADEATFNRVIEGQSDAIKARVKRVDRTWTGRSLRESLANDWIGTAPLGSARNRNDSAFYQTIYLGSAADIQSESDLLRIELPEYVNGTDAPLAAGALVSALALAQEIREADASAILQRQIFDSLGWRHFRYLPRIALSDLASTLRATLTAFQTINVSA